jgi:nitrate reductase gamma subunit
MDNWIALARGPLFRLSLAVCLLGLAYHLGNTLAHIVRAHRRAADKRIPFREVVTATLRWLLPVRLLRANPLGSVASLIFHLGILLVPLFYIGHVRLWQAGFPLSWPVLAPGPSDVLSLLAAAALLLLLVGRLLVAASRQLTAAADALLLGVLLVLVLSGYWAAHPSASPLAPRAMVLAHMLLGDLALVLTPLSKIVHCVLTPLTQLVGELGWHFPAATGRHVAIALGKENEPV